MQCKIRQQTVTMGLPTPITLSVVCAVELYFFRRLPTPLVSNAVRALDPARGQKGIESHHNYNEMPPDPPKQ
jgi:hypothetical protein